MASWYKYRKEAERLLLWSVRQMDSAFPPLPTRTQSPIGTFWAVAR
jgi:hypothetical protein